MTDATSKQASDRHLWEFTAVRDALWIGVGVVLVWCGLQLRSVLTPVLLGFAVAYLLEPAVRWGHRKTGIPRVAVVSVIGLGVLGAVALIAWTTGPLAVRQLIDLTDHAPGLLERALSHFGVDATSALSAAEERVREKPSVLLGVVQSSWGTLADGARAITRSGFQLTTALFLIPVYAFFFSWRFEPTLRSAAEYLPNAQRGTVVGLVGKFDLVFGQFVRGRFAISAIQAVLFSLGYWAIDMPYWLVVGLVSGVLCFLPLVGFLAWPLALIVMFADAAKSGEEIPWVTVLVWPTVIQLVVQAIETAVLTPWIQGREMRMGPLMILTLVLVGGEIGGLFGILLATPLAACFKIFYEDLVRPRLERWADDAASST